MHSLTSSLSDRARFNAYWGILGIIAYSLGVAFAARFTDFDPAYYYLFVTFLAGALANVLASTFMNDNVSWQQRIIALIVSTALVLVLMLISPPSGRIVYPLDNDAIDRQTIHVSGTFTGLGPKSFLTICVLTPTDPSGRRHPCWSSRTHGALFETDSAIFLGTPNESQVSYTIELRVTDKHFSPFGEEMKSGEEGRLLSNIRINRVPESKKDQP